MAINNWRDFFFADGPMIHYAGIDYMAVEAKLQQNRTNIEQWFRSNKLTANVWKSSCMFIGARQILRDSPYLNAYVVLIARALPDLQQYDYLCLTIKNDVICDIQINKLCSKLRQKVGLLFRLRYKVPMYMLIVV